MNHLSVSVSRARGCQKKVGYTGFVVCLAVLLIGDLSLAWSAEDSGDGAPHYYQPTQPDETTVVECDVAVYGGTPAGVTAAIQAARMGRKAMLFSFNRHVGGLTSGGLTATDLGRKDSIGGLALEFYTRIKRISGFRPAEAEVLFRKMLEEAGVEVHYPAMPHVSRTQR